jgi:hypothetical protein
MGNEEVGEIGIHIYFTSGLVFANMSATTTHAVMVKMLTQLFMKEVFFVQRAISSHVELCCEFFSEKHLLTRLLSFSQSTTVTHICIVL